MGQERKRSEPSRVACNKCGLVDVAFPTYGRQCKPCIARYKKEFYSIPKNRERKRLRNRQWRVENPEKAKEQGKRWYGKNPEKIKAKEKNRIEKLRKEVRDAYGGACRCCGETEPMFLTIDHENNDGAKHRMELTGTRDGGGVGVFYRWLRKQGFPKERFRLLCYNCNLGRARNKGPCPHEANSRG